MRIIFFRCPVCLGLDGKHQLGCSRADLDWHPWFAWRPVFIRVGVGAAEKIGWLRHVQRKKSSWMGPNFTTRSGWEYRD